MPNPGTKYKRSNMIFFVSTIAFTYVHMCTELLQLLAWFLMWSPGTLGVSLGERNTILRTLKERARERECVV